MSRPVNTGVEIDNLSPRRLRSGGPARGALACKTEYNRLGVWTLSCTASAGAGMPDPGIHSARTADAQARRRHPGPRHGACPACRADLVLLPSTARFCSRCGEPLAPPLRPGYAPRAARWLWNLWCACPDADVDVPAWAGRSSVLLAFGKSMFNLGWRYEHAVGARRNLDEAERCYGKAARLGDPSAMRRFGHVLDAADAPSPPADPVSNAPGRHADCL